MKLGQRYALLTVDTEALPKRALRDHVNRLIWGRHENGTAGIKEICSIGDEFGVKHVFFVDMCGAYHYPDAIGEVVRWLDGEDQDVQLHVHPEVLPRSFWTENKVEFRPEYLNDYSQDSWAEFVIGYFGQQLSGLTGRGVVAYRAGSFRWNACTIRALKTAKIPLSFNNSMRAYAAGRCLYSEPGSLPYVWSNGVIEVPATEKRIQRRGGRELWAGLTFPDSSYFPFQAEKRSFLSGLFNGISSFVVIVLHSWSLLYWDENGYATYVDDQRIEQYRRLLAALSADYDVITAREFLDLYRCGKIVPTHTVDIRRAEFAVSS